LSAAWTLFSEPNSSVGTRPPNPSPRGCHRFRLNLSKIYQYNLYWPLSPTLYFCICFVVSGMQGYKKRPIYGCRFPMQVHQYFINNSSSSFKPSQPHVLSFYHTHLTTLSHSLGGKDDSRSYLASTAKAGSNTKTRGKVEMTPLSNRVKRRSWECPYPRTQLYV
jgi:hypothetical protein